jgi:phospholipase D1/2
MVQLEGKSVTAAEHASVHDKCGHNTICQAMVHLIEHAEHYIYIENQFFVSAFGNEGFGDQATGPKPLPSPEVQLATSYVKKEATRRAWGDADAYPTNIIGEALGTKICNMILDTSHPSPDGKSSPFHVYITLPVHPEGLLNDPSTMTQVHFTMQSLVYGSQSLLNRIRRAIAARRLVDKMDTTYERVFNDENTEYKSVPIEQCWPYLTLLNLRNWEKIGDRYVTEQIYVHNKTMIVDDCYAIVGSANINDRSQLGNRDSELAVLVVDTDFSYEHIGSKDGPSVTRAFARKLRMAIWNKILGNTGGTRPAGLSEVIAKPAAHSSWEAIRLQAKLNTSKYEAAFPFIPANGKSIWPAITMNGTHRAFGSMPFDDAFWQNPTAKAEATQSLPDVKGYITLLPWEWTLGQNNNSGMHSALFGMRDGKSKVIDESFTQPQAVESSPV